MRHKTPHKKRPKRLGCGIGSGHGKTSTKGHKGQRARSGFALNPGFEGGQNPLYRRLPKRGFNRSAFKKVYAIVNLQTLAKLEDKEITPELLLAKNVIKELYDGLKVLGSGELKNSVATSVRKYPKDPGPA
jgi:large subunit ribosomal protein L15